MSRDVDLSKLRKWIGKAETAAEPPRRPAKSGDPIVQLNLKVPSSLKRRMKHLAARDDLNLTALLSRMVDEYERAHGALPSIQR